MTPMLMLLAQASTVPSEPISVRINPEKVCVDGRGNRNPNFDFHIVNRGAEAVSITEIMAHGRGKTGELIEQRVLWQDGLASLGEERSIAAKSEELIFNPFTFSRPEKAVSIDYRIRFSDGSAKEVRIAPADCTTKAKLRLPVKGRVLVYDGYDVLSHHRRDRWYMREQFRALGVVDSPWRFSLDLIPVDEAGGLFRGAGSRIEDFYGWNTPVVSPADGVVTAARGTMPDNALGSEKFDRKPLSEDPMTNSGNYVLIDHGNGEVSALTHLKSGSVLVKKGDKIRAGQPVARIGNSGSTPIPHLHYELRSGYGVSGVRAMPPYFSDIDIVGEPAPTKPIAINTGDVVIGR